jgi:integrase
MKLIERFHAVCAQRHFSPRTVECYEMWIRQFLHHFRQRGGSWRRPLELRGGEVGQTLLGHASLKTTMIYTHVMNKPAIAVISQIDRLAPAGDSHPNVRSEKANPPFPTNVDPNSLQKGGLCENVI